jgi:hypothetical protein
VFSSQKFSPFTVKWYVLTHGWSKCR